MNGLPRRRSLPDALRQSARIIDERLDGQRHDHTKDGCLRGVAVSLRMLADEEEGNAKHWVVAACDCRAWETGAPELIGSTCDECDSKIVLRRLTEVPR